MGVLEFIGRGLALGLVIYVLALAFTVFIRYRRRWLAEQRENKSGVQTLFDGEN